MKLEQGSNLGYKVSFSFEGNEKFIDDIQRKSFTILYTGDGASATMSITKTGLTTTVAGTPAHNLNVDFDAYQNIEEMVNFINDNPNYTCQVMAPDPKNLTSHLDSVENVNIKA
jgi:hypothetical protein